MMQITLVHIGSAPAARDGFDALVRTYLERCSAYAATQAMAFRTEAALLDWLKRKTARTVPVAALLDSRGRAMSSEAFAGWLGARRDEGAQHIVFAIGPASGWSEDARKHAQLLVSLSQMTLAHSLARLVLAEQLYRACTILAGHPYHVGH